MALEAWRALLANQGCALLQLGGAAYKRGVQWPRRSATALVHIEACISQSHQCIPSQSHQCMLHEHHGAGGGRHVEIGDVIEAYFSVELSSISVSPKLNSL